MHPALDVSLDTDLGPFSRLLWQHRLAHRIQRVEDRQVLLVSNPAQTQPAQLLFEQWARGEIVPSDKDGGDLRDIVDASGLMSGLVHVFRHAPLTLALIAACCVLAVIAPLAEPSGLTMSLLYPDFSYGTRTIVLARVLSNFGVDDFLRMLSPILLHGGLLHLVFNMLWLWELGGRIERLQSSLSLAATIVILALLSNTVQYFYGASRFFGGMSGVVYGLFAYIWMWQLFDRRCGLALPSSLIWFMLISLLVMTALDLDMIANEAHLGGFLAGLFYGVTTATFGRLARAANRQEGSP